MLGIIERDQVKASEKKAIATAPQFKDYIETITAPVYAQRLAAKAAKGWVNPDGTEINTSAKNEAAVASCLRALTAGYEPTTPPSHWYCGMLPLKAKKNDGLRRLPEETWPNRIAKDAEEAEAQQRERVAKMSAAEQRQWHEGGGWWWSQSRYQVSVFMAPLPAEAYSAYQEATALFGEANVRIYSPDRNHFQERRVQPIDPVIIGRVEMGADSHYFEVFRWDIKEDIAHALNAARK